ncbi:MAG: hypothetical protein IJ853_03445, partial [Rickettsiales bacterium]|nr:hypothetical protein [Rickettsiales bacterium]
HIFFDYFLSIKLLLYIKMNTMKIEAVENAEVLKKPVDKIYEIADKEKGVEDIKFKSFSYAVKDQNNNIIGGITGWRAFDEI